MPDDKNSREKQAHDLDRRQRERDTLAEIEREDETEPAVDVRDLDALMSELDSLTFPATGSEVVAEIGDNEVNTVHRSYTIADLVPDTNVVKFGSPADVQTRVRRPTVAAAMKRVIEASEPLPRTVRRGTPWAAYEKTFQALHSIEADDEDEGITVISDWIVERISADQELPGSRAVRREAASWCREQGYQVSSDDWLGI